MRKDGVSVENHLASAPLQIHKSDLEIASCIVARDRKATARLVALHTDAVHMYVWRRLAPRTDMVEDIVQDVFVAALRSMGAYAGEASLRVWLTGIAFHKVKDYYRKTLNSHTEETGLEADQYPTATVDLVSELDAVRQAKQAAQVLLKMPEAYAVALRWRYWDGSTAREMAAASGKTEKSIERLLARARERFKSLWLTREGAS